MTINSQQLVDLRQKFDRLPGINVDSPTYAKLCALLDHLDDVNLIAVCEAKIKYVSALAWNRLYRRGLV